MKTTAARKAEIAALRRLVCETLEATPPGRWVTLKVYRRDDGLQCYRDYKILMVGLDTDRYLLRASAPSSGPKTLRGMRLAEKK